MLSVLFGIVGLLVGLLLVLTVRRLAMRAVRRAMLDAVDVIERETAAARNGYARPKRWNKEKNRPGRKQRARGSR